MVRAGGPRGGGGQGGPRARPIAHLHPRSDPCISLHTLQTLTDPYVLLHILAYSYILLQILTNSAYPCISLHTLTYPYRLRGLGGGGPRARTILGTNEYIRGVCRAKCQYDKIGLMGYCSATLGPIVQHLKCIVGSPQAPGPVQALGRELT